jgi:hypothetical protein
MPKLVFLATDIALFLQLAVVAIYAWHAWNTPALCSVFFYSSR